MKNILNQIKFLFRIIRFLPHIILFYTHTNKEQLKHERNTWIKTIKHDKDYSFRNFLWLLNTLPEYRSVLYWRLGSVARILKVFAKGQQSLHINLEREKISSGLVFQHGYSTIIDANKIGHDCQIWHNVTIGTNKSNSGNKPKIGDNVKICCGAIVIGSISIGNNVTIGAGSVITKNVPDNVTVVGNPAHIIIKNGKKIFEKL